MRGRMNYIDVTRLEPGTSVLLETEINVFELVFTDPVAGEMMMQGGGPEHICYKMRPAVLLGSTKGGDIVKQKQIHRGYYLTVKVWGDDIASKAATFNTGEIRSAKIVAPGEAWSYEMEWDGKDQKKLENKKKETSK